MQDGLQSEQYRVEDIIFADSASGAALKFYGASETLTGSLVATTSVIANSKILSAIGTGSPTTTWGKVALAGTGTTGVGSNAWHVFPTAFAAAPVVVACSTETNEALLVKAGSIGVGSFYVETTSASQDFSWFAVA